MKTGLLIVNSFLNTTKYSDIYKLLSEAARSNDINLEVYGNGDFLLGADNSIRFPSSTSFDFAIYWDKDIPLAKSLEAGGLRLFNSSEAVRVCDNKALTMERLSGLVPIPKTYRIPLTFAAIGYTDTSFLDLIEDELGFPYVLKECYGSFGAQVYLIHSRSEAINALKLANGRECIAQEYIKSSSGRDIRIHTVGDRVVTSMLRRNDNDFRANISNGGYMTKYEPTTEEIQMALNVSRILGLDFAGIDILFGENGPILCEVNSNAHFKNILNLTGVNVADSIMAYIAGEIYS